MFDRAVSLWISAVLAALTLISGVRAEPVATAETEYTKNAIYAERDGFVPGETTWFALRQEVRKGWHVFWVNPGDAGLPLSLNWSLPEGFQPGDVNHPVPDYIPVGPLASYAHEGAPVFLAPVDVPVDAEVGETISVTVNASWQTCEEICVPEETSYKFTLPVLATDDAPANEYSALFAAARAARPQTLDNAAQFRRAGAQYELVVREWNGEAPETAFFFPEKEGLTTPAAEQSVRLERGDLKLAMAPGWVEAENGETIAGILSIESDGDKKAFAMVAEAEIAPVAVAASDTTMRSLPALIVLAFLGGLILNAMPCVFPILFVKAASLMQSAQSEPAIMRRHGLLYGAGVVVTFALIGAALIALRAGGEQLGWGFHLQSPLVVGLSAYVLFAVGLNLAGVFTVGESLTGAGDSLTRGEGDLSVFFTGALAVAVAAPCIGPLLTAPMGAALTQGPAVSMVIFIAMALGLAAPFMAITFAPGLARMLPKPGPWMSVFKQALAFPVFAAAAYFLWVFARQTGDASLGGALGGLVLLAAAAWLFDLSKGEGTRALILRGVSALVLAAALAPLLNVKPTVAASGPIERYGALSVEPFDREAIAAYNAESRPVFTIFTAAWCITCQADKLTVFSNAEVANAIAGGNGIVMVADWTLRDAVITDELAVFGAGGVPFYAYYGPGGDIAPMAPPISKKEIIAQFN